MAMSGTLKVSPDKLVTISVEFNDQARKVNALTKEMLGLVNGLTGVWQSDAQKEYSRKFKALDGDMAQIYKKIHEHVDDLRTMAETYKGAENKNVTTVGGLSSDYISG